MSEPVQKKRRSREELKAFLQAKLEAIDKRRDVANKIKLLKLAEELKVVADERADKSLGALVVNLTALANAIKAEIPQ